MTTIVDLTDQELAELKSLTNLTDPAAAGNWPSMAGVIRVQGCMKKPGLTVHVELTRAKWTMASVSCRGADNTFRGTVTQGGAASPPACRQADR